MHTVSSLLVVATIAQGAETFEGNAYYLGDPHLHTGISADGFSTDVGRPGGALERVGSLAGAFDLAVDNGLDWLAISDHINGVHGAAQEDWELGQALVLAHDAEATGLLLVPAVEYFLRDTAPNWGTEHRNLYFFADNSELEALEWEELVTGFDGSITCEDLGVWLDAMSASYGDLMLIPHHPSNLAPTNWSCFDETYTPAVEIYSGWGNALGGFLGTWEPPIYGISPSTSVTRAMDEDRFGLRFGFWGGTDAHTTLPGDLCIGIEESRVNTGGLTVAMLDSSEEWSRATLHDAIIERRTYATSGPLLPLVLELYSQGALIGTLGDEIQPAAGEDLQIELRMPADYEWAVATVLLSTPTDIYNFSHDTAGTWSLTLTSDEIPPWFYVAVQIDGLAWYGEDACDDGGDDDLEWIWVSPTWIDVQDHDWDQDGVSWGKGDCDDSDPTRHPGAPEIWYDGVDQGCDGGDDFDQDGDGYPADTAGGLDCDDTRAAVHPGAIDRWYDGVDQDCDGRSDFDRDLDGYDAGGGDCDDDQPSVNPDAAEIWYDGIDQDCSGGSDFDQDGDGWELGRDCDDGDVTAWPGAPGWSLRCTETTGPGPSGCSQAPSAPGGRAVWWLLAMVGVGLFTRRDRRSRF